MAKTRAVLECAACGHRVSQWVGRCPACGGWGSIEEHRAPAGSERATPARPVPLREPGEDPLPERRLGTGIEGVDRVLGGGLVPGSVVLLAGEPGIGKSTLLLQLAAHLSEAGSPALLVSGEESRRQVASRARRLGVEGGAVTFAPGRDLAEVVETARAERPAVLAVDSIQSLRDPDGSQMVGGVSQVRMCADALVGLAKSEGVAVLVTGHVTKDGDLAGPRALEHAVDVVLSFEGDPRSGLRILACGKNRFGVEGETAWFEMGSQGLCEIDPTSMLVTADPAPGAAVALHRSGRRALAVEVQALVGRPDGPARRQTTGLDARRFGLVAAVLDRVLGLPLGRAELYGATVGGARVDDPACDLAIAAALVSAVTGIEPPPGAAFVGELSLTGSVRRVSGLDGRLAAARAAGCHVVFTPADPAPSASGSLRIEPVRHVAEALAWARAADESGRARADGLVA